MGNIVPGSREDRPRVNSLSEKPAADEQEPPWRVKGAAMGSVLADTTTLHERWVLLSLEDMADQIDLEAHCEGDRYYSRFVYKHSRVPLSGGRYINANYVLHKQYIASQAPLSETLAPFWEMVLKQRVTLVIMLTRLVEGSRTKAFRYWPTTNQPVRLYDDKEFDIEDEWRVELLEKSVHEDNLLRRDLQITRMETGEQSDLVQLHYIGWPDHGCPAEVSEIVALLAGVEELAAQSTGPILVHCSAGIGRTGTFIALRHELLRAVQAFRADGERWEAVQAQEPEEQVAAIQAFLCEHEFTVDETIRALRRDRKLMVQKEEQMVFCYEFFHFLMEDERANYLIEEFLLPVFLGPSSPAL